MKNLKEILEKGKKVLIGAGLISLLNVPLVNCGTEDDSGGGSSGSYSSYDPDAFWKACCYCLDDNGCMGVSASTCIKSTQIPVDPDCLKEHCYSICSSVGEIKAY